MTGPDTALAGRPTESAAAGPSHGTITELITGILNDAQKLARQQMDMFKAEVREDMNRTRQALIFGGVAVTLLTVGLLAFVFGCVYLIDHFNPVLPLWGSFMIFAAICSVAGVVLGFVARNLFESFNPLPDKTFNALQENLTWKTQPQA
jgi:uncharacterized membrane protein YqjE